MKIIKISGYPGSGKTTFSSYMKRALPNSEVLELDSCMPFCNWDNFWNIDYDLEMQKKFFNKIKRYEQSGINYLIFDTYDNPSYASLDMAFSNVYVKTLTHNDRYERLLKRDGSLEKRKFNDMLAELYSKLEGDFEFKIVNDTIEGLEKTAQIIAKRIESKREFTVREYIRSDRITDKVLVETSMSKGANASLTSACL